MTVVPHVKMAWGGTLGTGNVDIWTNGLSWANDGTIEPDRAGLVRGAEAVAPVLQAWFSSNDASKASFISSDVKLSWLKLNVIKADGLQRDSNTVQYDYPAAVAGPFTVANPPIWAQSYCLTLRTGVKRGRGHSGRIFPPVCGPPRQSGSPYIATVDADSMALNFGTFIRDARNAMFTAFSLDAIPVWGAEQGYDLVVISRSTATEPPLSTEITGVVVDKVADIQHRRTNRVPRAEGATIVIADIP